MSTKSSTLHDHDEEICRHRGARCHRLLPRPKPSQDQHPCFCHLGAVQGPCYTHTQALSLPTQIVPGVQKICEAQSNDFEHSFHNVDGEEDVVEGHEVPLCEDMGVGREEGALT